MVAAEGRAQLDFYLFILRDGAEHGPGPNCEANWANLGPARPNRAPIFPLLCAADLDGVVAQLFSGWPRPCAPQGEGTVMAAMGSRVEERIKKSSTRRKRKNMMSEMRPFPYGPLLAGLEKVQKTKCKRRGKGKGRTNEEKKASKVILRPFAQKEDILMPSPVFDNLSELGESSSSELGKQVASGVSESVVSIASFLGETMLHECTGMFIEGSCADATSILTVAHLVATPDRGITDDVTLKCAFPMSKLSLAGYTITGWLHNSDLNYDLAVVNIRRTSGFQTVHLSSSHHVRSESNHEVVAVGRCFNSGTLKYTNGIVISSPSNGRSELMFSTKSTCEIDTAWVGGPLVDFEGNFVGVNCRSEESTEFLPKNKVLECLGPLRKAALTVGNGRSARWPLRLGQNRLLRLFEKDLKSIYYGGFEAD
ncbi:hypothetical protein ACP70R_044496 [Stipagrostis hirtigluma subsp. patula]